MSKCPHRKYVIFSTSETGSINYSEVMETTGSTLRLNKSGSLTFVKYDRPSGSYIPASVAALETRVENIESVLEIEPEEDEDFEAEEDDEDEDK